MKRKSIFVLLTLLALVGLLAMPFVPPRSHAQSRAAQPPGGQPPIGQVVRSGQGVSRQGRISVQPPLPSAVRKALPHKPPEHEMEENDDIRLDPPVDPRVRPEEIRPTSPPSTVKVGPRAVSGKLIPKRNGPLDPSTFDVYENSTLASAPVVGGTTLNTYNPVEPSGATDGRVFFYTTNNYAAASADRGQTFTYYDPFTNFTSVNGGFGGDQYVYYERTRGLMFWLLQYQPDSNTNTQRLAVARTPADVLNNNFYTYDFTPATYGLTNTPAGANGYWMDFPDMAVSDNFLYLTTNVFQRVVASPNNNCTACPNLGGSCPVACGGQCTSSCNTVGVGAVIARIPLDQLAQAQGLNFNYFTDSNFGYRLTQGAHGTIYWGSHNSNTQIRIYHWDENSNTISWDDVNHEAFNTGTMTATSPDGNNFAGFADTRILGGWIAGGVIGFMWNAAQGGNFSYPYVEVVRFNESDRTLLGQGQVYNNNNAFMYPSVQPNDRGALGGTMAYGGGTLYPSMLAWIADDYNNGTITPLESVAIAVGTAGPACNRWGDYFATRINVPYSNTWMGTGYVVNTSTCNGIATGGNNWEPHFAWFGRDRDAPPQTNTIYVDLRNTSLYQDGTAAHPYSTVTAGNFAALAGDTIIIQSGNYNETPRLVTPTTINAQGGAVIIGKP